MTDSSVPVEPNCARCSACRVHWMPEFDADAPFSERVAYMSIFIVCATCGHKRCPHATDHRLPCSGSNEMNQPGSSYQSRYWPDERERLEGF